MHEKNIITYIQEQRYKLENHLAIGTQKAVIALELEVSEATIYLEINRNSDVRNKKHKANLAQKKCNNRHTSKEKRIKFTQQLRERIVELLQSDFSPEQIHGFLTKEQEGCIS